MFQPVRAAADSSHKHPCHRKVTCRCPQALSRWCREEFLHTEGLFRAKRNFYETTKKSLQAQLISNYQTSSMNRTSPLCCASAHWGREKRLQNKVSATQEAESNWYGSSWAQPSFLSSPGVCWKRMDLPQETPGDLWALKMYRKTTTNQPILSFKKTIKIFEAVIIAKTDFHQMLKIIVSLAWQNKFANFLVYYFLWFSAVLPSGIWEVKTDRWL